MGQWESAATFADRDVAGSLLRGKDATTLRSRPLRDEDFEFRGGGERVEAGDNGRPWQEDR